MHVIIRMIYNKLSKPLACFLLQHLSSGKTSRQEKRKSRLNGIAWSSSVNLLKLQENTFAKVRRFISKASNRNDRNSSHQNNKSHKEAMSLLWTSTTIFPSDDYYLLFLNSHTEIIFYKIQYSISANPANSAPLELRFTLTEVSVLTLSIRNSPLLTSVP